MTINYFQGGGGRYDVRTGRRDSLASAAHNLNSSLPSPSISVSESIKLFADKGLTPTDMVLLLGTSYIKLQFFIASKFIINYHKYGVIYRLRFLTVYLNVGI